MAQDQTENLEARLAALQEEMRVLKEQMLPMLMEIRERLLRRPDEAY